MPTRVRNGDGRVRPVFFISTDPSLDAITGRLVWATIGLAIATLALAALQFRSVLLQGRELRLLAAQIVVTLSNCARGWKFVGGDIQSLTCCTRMDS
jgi:hypothetical protein